MSVGIIGGTGLTSLEGLEITRREVVRTPFGEPSAPLIHGTFRGHDVTFLARHGHSHNIPPHQVNYRANIWALRHVGVDRVIAVAAVGGLGEEYAPRRVAIPDQIIDYTHSRIATFYHQDLDHVTHIDFTYPYDGTVREWLLGAAREAGVDAIDGGTYGATQGPRLETAAEIRRMRRDGCDLVGMTGMPEAALAREAELRYAHCAVVANWAAGMGDGAELSMDEIRDHLLHGMEAVRRIIAALS
ncbi:MAG: S-methyl-5'-thioinosine phosphorylase [Halorhodospira halophila]|uniref:S-methyl-5'-thioinosine phosphorylase n=1 Tax=Halorhodospira TaxID=85108 RepID=UPI001912E283|nr:MULTISPECIES: S-methyl-5'-thioinosine phosphorylase [Halorhodospira]MBK5936844.1 5'-methylthioadenosine phosphorylase [Halorhodospira halophila]MBK5942289.1 5'-methylthioadenosine phosphorylase [Halorhodospira halophila]MCC3750370.1 S-methyl-5'-thioinosine phosphorylase [Halorhodospira halophila]MCG5528071.1 S-methyl-5'-thioinosine phosphorylase [Halorhodospira halophila]MCG5531840.1 S-methyl-5'-thioinosine phosphorylase [Halorhodospira sp. 9621]